MDYAQIERFLTIVKHMNLGKAAGELYISQSALSQSISNLEKELGFSLFHRISNKLVLTREAETLLPDFEEIHKAYLSFEERKESLLQKETLDYVTIGFAGNAVVFATLSLSEFFNNYPKEIVNTTYTSRDLLPTMLREGQIDFAITYPPLSFHDISSTPLRKEATAVAVPVSHPLAKKEKLKTKELEKYPFLGLKKGHHFRNNCENICAQCGIRIRYAKTGTRQELSALIEENRKDGEMLFFCAEHSFHEMTGEDGYVLKYVDDARFDVITALSWISTGKAQYQHKDFMDYITNNYSRTRNEYERLYSHIFNDVYAPVKKEA
ncbi:MAG: LysR family transcriptional regulator [Lachnospiraceae bacterium]|nr:LysR family transcriptional regulator [Lachnospiraceae bacterium]